MILARNRSGGICGFSFALQLQQTSRFLQGFFETFWRNGFDQVIHHIQVEALVSKFLVRGHKDDHGAFIGQRLNELQPANVGHIDVAQKQINRVVLQIFGSCDRIRKGGEQCPLGYIPGVFFNQHQGQGFVVEGNEGHGARFNWSLTTWVCPSLWMLRLCLFG